MCSERLRARRDSSRGSGTGNGRAPVRPRRPLRRRECVHQVDAGSDPDAAVYWLARMLEAGEDARFIARRMIIFASEDVGLADRSALPVAVAAAHALEHVGLPEARCPVPGRDLPGDRAEEQPIGACLWTPAPTVRDGAVGEVPAHLRDSHYQAAAPSATASATSILTTMPVPSSISSTCPTGWSTAIGTSRARTATSGRSAGG